MLSEARVAKKWLKNEGRKPISANGTEGGKPWRVIQSISHNGTPDTMLHACRRLLSLGPVQYWWHCVGVWMCYVLPVGVGEQSLHWRVANSPLTVRQNKVQRKETVGRWKFTCNENKIESAPFTCAGCENFKNPFDLTPRGNQLQSIFSFTSMYVIVCQNSFRASRDLRKYTTLTC